MKSFCCFLLVFMACHLCSHAQSSRYFRKIIGLPGAYGENGNSVKQLPDGTYAIAGVRGDQFNQVDCFVDHVNIYGNLISEIGMFDLTVNNFYQNLQLTNDGLIIVGVERTPPPFVQFPQITKTDYNGNILWSKTISNASLNSAPYNVRYTNDSGFILCGYTTIDSALYWDTNVIKLDSLGNVIFDSVYVAAFNDIAYCIDPLPDGSFAFAGHENFIFGYGNGYLHKIDSVGNTIWRQVYHYPGDQSTSISSFCKYSNNEFMLAGWSGSSLGYQYNPFLIKCDSMGNQIWFKKLLSNSSQYPYYYGNISKIMTLDDGDLIGCGSFYHQPSAIYLRMTLFKTDSTGELKWIRFFTPDFTDDAYGYDMDTTSDGGYIISGRRDTTGGADIYLVKTNCLGFYNKPKADFSVTWNGNEATFYNLSIRADTCIYYFGDGDSALVMLTDTVPVVHQYPGPGPWQAYLLAYACGEIDTADQSITTGLENLADFYEKTFSVYPIPAKNTISVSYIIPGSGENGRCIIHDITGKAVKRTELNRSEKYVELDVSDISSGSYIISLEVDKRIKIQKKLVVIKD